MSYDKSTENKAVEVFCNFLDDFCDLGLTKTQISNLAVDMLRNGSEKQFSTIESVVYFFDSQWSIKIEPNQDDLDIEYRTYIMAFSFEIFELFNKRLYGLDDALAAVMYKKFIFGDGYMSAADPLFRTKWPELLFTLVNQMTTLTTYYSISIMSCKNKMQTRHFIIEQFKYFCNKLFSQNHIFY
ncbi:hypothetical protein [Campylobacter majalis]|uniref:hypothetical protein n=1 Tax=Campylobacter majalis TaxID=2790656 RepID=UPI003D6863BD